MNETKEMQDDNRPQMCFEHYEEKATHIRNSFFLDRKPIGLCEKCAEIFQMGYPIDWQEELHFRQI